MLKSWTQIFPVDFPKVPLKLGNRVYLKLCKNENDSMMQNLLYSTSWVVHPPPYILKPKILMIKTQFIILYASDRILKEPAKLKIDRLFIV